MRYLVISDIHSNIQAFEAVLDEVKDKHLDKYLFLGDAVGYAANPNKVISRLRRLEPLVAVRGNHDKVVAGVDSGFNFNESALRSAIWTRNKVTERNMLFLKDLAKGPVIVDEILCISHGSPYDEDKYIFGIYDAKRAINESEQWITFFGHTHSPVFYQKEGDNIEVVHVGETGSEFNLDRDKKYLINPGSVGQPRDRIPLSSFAVLDTEKDQIEIRRIKYDIKSVQEAIKAARLPKSNSQRLEFGR